MSKLPLIDLRIERLIKNAVARDPSFDVLLTKDSNGKIIDVGIKNHPGKNVAALDSSNHPGDNRKV